MKPQTPKQGGQGLKAEDSQEEAAETPVGLPPSLALPHCPSRTSASLSWSGARLSMMMSFFRSSSMVDL